MDTFKTDEDCLKYLANFKWLSGYTKVFIDEFVYGGKEELKQDRSYDSKKKKVVAAVEIDEKGGVKRAYFKTIDNYSSKESETIFDAHIYDFFEINNVIHQIKLKKCPLMGTSRSFSKISRRL